jgi:hypothetical protein
LVSDRDEQSRYVLAMLIRLLKRGAGAVRLDSLAAESHRHFVGIRIGTLDFASSGFVIDGDLLNDPALFIVKPTQESSRTK